MINFKPSTEMLQFEFIVNPADRKIIYCSVNKPFKIKSLEFERENVLIFSYQLDGAKLKIDTRPMRRTLEKPMIVRNDFSFIAVGEKLVLPEKVVVTLFGEYV